MIKSLRDARLVDGLPRVVAGQKWVQALSEALGETQEQILDFADDSQIYTNLDNAKEEILDALAISWKVDWYDPNYTLEQKRRTIKAALTVRRLMGTVHAVKVQADAIYPGSGIEEWFEYNGTPGYFRLCVNITDTDEEHPIAVLSSEDVERKLITAKRYSAHLENVSYMVRRALLYGFAVERWLCNLPECGTIRCGTWHSISTLGYSEDARIAFIGNAEGYNASPPPAGTIPDISELGYSLINGMIDGVSSPAAIYSSTPPLCGLNRCGA